MIRAAILSAILCALAGCHGGSSPSPPPAPVVTIPDLSAYFAMSRCTADGMPAVLEPGCAAAPQRASDAMLFRLHDWSGHTDGQISDAFVSDAGDYYVQSFSYPPHGPFVASHGDGGDLTVIDSGVARIDYTQNGTPGGGTVAGYWAGPGCFDGSGWVIADNQAPSGSWRSGIARLAGAASPGACPPLNSAVTRWRVEIVAVPFRFGGKTLIVSLPALISEHYAGVSIATASSMERVILAQGFGRVLWQAWSTTGPSESFADPGMAPWTAAPASGWYLKDERILTDIEPGGEMSGALYQWPGAGFAP